MTRCADCPSTVECWQHEETNAPPCRGIAELEAEVAAARDLRERLSRRYATRAEALAAINPAHTFSEDDTWDFESAGGRGVELLLCGRCGAILLVDLDRTWDGHGNVIPGRIQLTDAAHEVVCVPFGSGEAT